jgi:quercetin dioxygenase-like cupin family protein
MALLSRQRVLGEKAMISRVVLEQGCDVPVHSHDNEQVSVIISGRLRFTLGDEATVREVVAGEVLMLPSGCPHGAYAVEETVVLDIFAPPSAVTGIDRRG